MELLVYFLAFCAMLPFATATLVALAIAAMPLMIVVLSWDQARGPVERAPIRPVIVPLPHPSPA